MEKRASDGMLKHLINMIESPAIIRMLVWKRITAETQIMNRQFGAILQMQKKDGNYVSQFKMITLIAQTLKSCLDRNLRSLVKTTTKLGLSVISRKTIRLPSLSLRSLDYQLAGRTTSNKELRQTHWMESYLQQFWLRYRKRILENSCIGWQSSLSWIIKWQSPKSTTFHGMTLFPA